MPLSCPLTTQRPNKMGVAIFRQHPPVSSRPPSSLPLSPVGLFFPSFAIGAHFVPLTQFGFAVQQLAEVAACAQQNSSKPPPRHHPRHKPPDDLRLVLARDAFKRIRAFERIRSRNPHLPPGHSPENRQSKPANPRAYPSQTTRHRARILPQSHPRRRMIWAYGDTGCSPSCGSQTRKPQLGASHSARSRSAY
jgi:hypothetical protein